MKIDWTNPELVSLHERLAACIQQQLEDDLTSDGHVGDLPHFGARTATEIFQRALNIDVFGSSGEWTLSFTADPPPNSNRVIFCAICAVNEGELHRSYCDRRGQLLRQADAEVQL
jgi:hypothetical protein